MASRNELRALKRGARVQLRWDADYEDYFTERLCLPAGPHVPNKHEAQLLRHLMAQTGLTESQVRAHKTYRRQLAHASQKRGLKTSEQRYALRIRKAVLQRLRLPKEHPAVKIAFLEEAERRRLSWPGSKREPQELWQSIEAL